MLENPYGLTTGPSQLWGRSRACGIWISPWVDPGRPAVIDTAQMPTELTTKIAGADTFPADALLVVLHPQMYRDVLSLPSSRYLTGPEFAAGMIDMLCKREPGLSARMRWTYLGRRVE